MPVLKFQIYFIFADLKRAYQTAEAIRRSNGSFDKIEKCNLARERSFGDLEGRQVDQMIALTKGKSKTELFEWGPPNGETGRQFR